MKNLVSVIIPVYNRADLIGETLNSVLAQTHRNWECIIVDDGSTDNTLEVLEAYATRDRRFKLYQRPETRKKGASPCRNYGIEKASGDYIQFLDSDDLLKDNKFEEQLKLLEKEDQLCLVTCKWGSFSDSARLNVKTKWNSYGRFEPGVKLLYFFGKYNEYFPPIVYMVPKAIIDKAGFWDESLRNNPNDDGEYFSRVLLNTPKVLFCDSTEAYYRAGDTERLSLLDDELKIKSAIESWKMIRDNLKTYKKICRVYSHNGIKNIYKQIKDSYPAIISDYSEFFEENVPSKKWYHRLIGN